MISYAFLLVSIPNDIEQLVQDSTNPISVFETITVFKPIAIVSSEETDRENDGSLLSPRDAIRRTMDYYHNRSLKTDQQGNSIYTPLQRAFDRKSGNKLARMGGLCCTTSFAIEIYYNLMNFIRFGDGLCVKEHIDNEQYNRLFLFHRHINNIIKQKMNEATLYGVNKRPIIVINKAAVKAAEVLYEYVSKTIDLLFDDASVVKSDSDSTKISNNLSMKKFVIINSFWFFSNSFLIRCLNSAQKLFKYHFNTQK